MAEEATDKRESRVSGLGSRTPPWRDKADAQYEGLSKVDLVKNEHSPTWPFQYQSSAARPASCPQSPRHSRRWFNICNSWCGLVASLFLGIIAGGLVIIIYGIILGIFTVGCCALSLAELAARYPTAGGQYHWTWLIAP
jgi:hypothetical protein